MSAIAATFVDIRTVKSRGQVQLVFEVPIAGADAVLAALGGIPQPQESRWVGIARLKDEPASVAPEPVAEPQEPPPAEPAKVTRLHERRDWGTLGRAQRAGIRCGDAKFLAWLSEREHSTIGVFEPEVAANVVRNICGVRSRAELDTDFGAGHRWDDLDAEFRNWQRQQETEARYADARR